MKKKYRPFHQLPYCCVPATLQWILYRRKLDILDQETIGVELGLCMPERFRCLLKNRKIKIKPNNFSNFGTQIEKKRYSINNFFDKYNIPLQISKKYFFANSDDLEKFILSNIHKKDTDIILRLNNSIFNDDSRGNGHFSVVVGYSRKNKFFLIGDPEPPFFKKASIYEVLRATSKEIDGIERGFYLVKNKYE